MDKQQLKPCPLCGSPARQSKGGEGAKAWFGTGCAGPLTCAASLSSLAHRTQEAADAAWNQREPQPPSASDERELPPMPAQMVLAAHVDTGVRIYGYSADQMQAYAQAALTGSPGVDAAWQKPVAWLIDWPDEPDLGQYFAEEPTATGRCRALVLAEAAPSPAASALAPHPPTRHCMCADCKPSFEPDQGWWMSEAERLIGVLCDTARDDVWQYERGGKADWVQSEEAYAAARAALLSHLRRLSTTARPAPSPNLDLSVGNSDNGPGLQGTT